MSSKQIEIVKMERCHLDAIDEIDKTCFSNPWSMKSLETELENPIANYFVALCDGKVAGYGGYWWVFFEGEITNIAVHEKFRRKGIASKILEAMIDKCIETDTSAIHLEVRVSNESAISLYKKFGFKEDGIRPKYYDNKEDALLMTKEIEKID